MDVQSVVAAEEYTMTGAAKEQEQQQQQQGSMFQPQPLAIRNDGSQRRHSDGSSMFGDVSIFRDFFLAAFSDGYNNVGCYR